MSIILDAPRTTDAARSLRADLVERAAALRPLLAGNADLADRDRAVPAENIGALAEAGLLSLTRPARHGGLQTDFRTLLEVGREVGRACGSTAWVTSLLNAGAWFVGLFPARAQDDVWAGAPDARTWTADNDVTRYKSAPTTAAAGVTTIVWENSEATGNTTGIPHTLTFDTSTEGYNHDVDLNVLANPFDARNGRHEATVTLTPGKYRYFCVIPGHGAMVGEFTVTAGGEDTTPPAVSSAVTGRQNAAGDFLGSATVTVTASDAGSGVRLVEHEVDATGFVPHTQPVRVTAIGEHSVRYRATDTAGNTAAERSVSFTVVESRADACPDSDERPTVVIGPDDTGGANVGTGDGCTIGDLVDQDRGYPDHGAFVRHVELVTDELVAAGVLTRRQQGVIVRAASRSDIGK